MSAVRSQDLMKSILLRYFSKNWGMVPCVALSKTRSILEDPWIWDRVSWEETLSALFLFCTRSSTTVMPKKLTQLTDKPVRLVKDESSYQG